MPALSASSTSSGKGLSEDAAACKASKPTCGPLPWVMTSVWPPRTRSARTAAARRTLARWFSAVIGSPRLSRALPPSATTMRISAADGGDEDRLDRVHAVFGLVEDDGGLRFEHLVGDLHAIDAVFLRNMCAYFRLRVVKSRQTMHELREGVSRRRHQLARDAVRCEKLDPLGPAALFLAHRQPDVGVDEVRALDTTFDILVEPEAASAAFGKPTHMCAERFFRPQLPGGGDAHVDAHFGGSDRQGLGDIVASFADEGDCHVRQVLVRELAHGHQIGKDLGRMILVGQAIIDRHARIAREQFDLMLAEPSI